MPPGPKPKPTSLKILAGNPGHRPLNKKEPQPTRKRLNAPRFLSPRAKEAWREISGELYNLGLLTVLDRMTLVLLCEAWADWRQASEMIRKEGPVIRSEKTGGLYQNPWAQVRNKAFDQLCRMAASFGLEPSSRTRLQVNPEDKERSLTEMLFEGIEISE